MLTSFYFVFAFTLWRFRIISFFLCLFLFPSLSFFLFHIFVFLYNLLLFFPEMVNYCLCIFREILYSFYLEIHVSFFVTFFFIYSIFLLFPSLLFRSHSYHWDYFLSFPGQIYEASCGIKKKGKTKKKRKLFQGEQRYSKQNNPSILCNNHKWHLPTLNVCNSSKLEFQSGKMS